MLRRLATALKPGGGLFTSFKHGYGEREHGGRRFTDLDEAGLAALLQTAPCFTMLETWITVDQRPDRPDDRWLNTVLQLDVIDHSVHVNLTPIMRKISNGKETQAF